MSRLINADELVKEIYREIAENSKNGMAFCDFELVDLVHDQPTAYDVEAVVAELEDEYEWNADCFHGTEGLDYLGQMRAYDNAIRIVKRGGRKECAECEDFSR